MTSAVASTGRAAAGAWKPSGLTTKTPATIPARPTQASGGRRPAGSLLTSGTATASSAPTPSSQAREKVEK